MRNVPRLYGGKVREYGRVIDGRSGLAVSGKSLGYGIAPWIFDIFWETTKGARADGVTGGLKGLGKGVLNLSTNLTVGMLGTVEYPSYGIYKSVCGVLHKKVQDKIMADRLAVVKHEEDIRGSPDAIQHVLERFQRFITG
jgi:hypothetical protein